MSAFFHILGWILLLTPFIALSVAVVLVYGLGRWLWVAQ